MNKRTKLFFSRILPIGIFSAALIATALWGNARNAEAKAYRTAVENDYRRAAYELTESVIGMEADLAKLTVAGTREQHLLLLNDLSRECGYSESLLSQLPASYGEGAKLNRFLVQMGDYARALCGRLLRGESLQTTDAEQLHTLHKAAAQLSLTLAQRMEAGEIPLHALTAEQYYSGPTAKDPEGIESFPTLIYDGPFSESSEKQEPLGLPKETVSEETALETLRTLLPEAEFDSAGRREGELPCYEFAGTLKDGREVSASVTVQGGKLLSFMGESTGSEEGIPSPEETETYRRSAERFLASLGYENMCPTYAQYYAGMAVMNFAACQEDVILYSDLIKVWVDRKNGEVLGMDATNYLYSHRERELPTPQYTRDDAAAMVSDALQIRSVRSALIPVTPMTEKLCYEFKGEYEGDSYIVYINAETLYEEQIFKIIDSENGQLTV